MPTKLLVYIFPRSLQEEGTELSIHRNPKPFLLSFAGSRIQNRAPPISPIPLHTSEKKGWGTLLNEHHQHDTQKGARTRIPHPLQLNEKSLFIHSKLSLSLSLSPKKPRNK
jgi:hypothetical protein